MGKEKHGANKTCMAKRENTEFQIRDGKMKDMLGLRGMINLQLCIIQHHIYGLNNE